MAEYPIPPWLGPQPQFGELKARGLAIGQAIANQRMQAQLQNRQLNQQAAQAEMEAELQSMKISAQMQLAQQEALQRQQQAAIEADYKQMTLRQAQQKMMQDAMENEQRMKLDLFKANTDWRKAAQSFDAQEQMTKFINTNAPTLGLEEATKRGYMQFGHLLGGALPGGVFPRERQAPSVTGIDVPGYGKVNVVQGGQALPPAMDANMPASVAAPGTIRLPKSGGGFEYRSADTTFTSKYDKQIDSMEDDMLFGPYIANRNLSDKGKTDFMKAIIKQKRDRYDKLIKLREEEKRLFDAQLYGGKPAPAAATNDFDFEWTGSTLK